MRSEDAPRSALPASGKSAIFAALHAHVVATSPKEAAMRSKMNRMMAQAVSLQAAQSGRSRVRPDVRVVEDKTTAVIVPPILPSWTVVMVAPRCEAVAVDALKEAGFDAWHPRMAILLSSSRMRKSVKVNRPLWPRYVFAARRKGCAKSLSDVYSVGFGVGVLPGPVVDAIVRREVGGEFDATQHQPVPEPFAPGAAVETLDGLMHGVVLRTEEGRVTVLFRLLGANREVAVPADALRMSA